MTLQKCPDCGGQVSSDAIACPHCGRPMRASAAFAAPTQTQHVIMSKTRGAYIILGVLLGVFGVHNFYAGYYGRGAVQLFITLAAGWFYGLGAIFVAIWVIYELFTVTADAQGNFLA